MAAWGTNRPQTRNFLSPRPHNLCFSLFVNHPFGAAKGVALGADPAEAQPEKNWRGAERTDGHEPDPGCRGEKNARFEVVDRPNDEQKSRHLRDHDRPDKDPRAKCRFVVLDGRSRLVCYLRGIAWRCHEKRQPAASGVRRQASEDKRQEFCVECLTTNG